MISATVSGVIHDIRFEDMQGTVATKLSWVLSSRHYVGSRPQTMRVHCNAWGRLALRVRSRVIDDAQCVAAGELGLIDGRLTLKVEAIEIVRPLQSQTVTVTLNGNH